MLAKARQIEDELREDQKILEELKSFAKKEEEEQSRKALEARSKQVEWLDGVSNFGNIMKQQHQKKTKFLKYHLIFCSEL